LWWAGLEETLLRRDRVVVDHQTIEVGTASAKRRAYARIERAWSAATNGYEAFCTQNDIDPEPLHWRRIDLRHLDRDRTSARIASF
jgi:hypothetical protein